jgi:hypothetical protein
MRIVLAFSLICGVAFVAPTIVTAAPLAVSEHAAMTKAVASGQSKVETVGWRARGRRGARRTVRGCGWQCTPYWRPYQYYNWQYYYPYGGPLF